MYISLTGLGNSSSKRYKILRTDVIISVKQISTLILLFYFYMNFLLENAFNYFEFNNG